MKQRIVSLVVSIVGGAILWGVIWLGYTVYTRSYNGELAYEFLLSRGAFSQPQPQQQATQPQPAPPPAPQPPDKEKK